MDPGGAVDLAGLWICVICASRASWRSSTSRAGSPGMLAKPPTGSVSCLRAAPCGELIGSSHHGGHGDEVEQAMGDHPGPQPTGQHRRIPQNDAHGEHRQHDGNIAQGSPGLASVG